MGTCCSAGRTSLPSLTDDSKPSFHTILSEGNSPPLANLPSQELLIRSYECIWAFSCPSVAGLSSTQIALYVETIIDRESDPFFDTLWKELGPSTAVLGCILLSPTSPKAKAKAMLSMQYSSILNKHQLQTLLTEILEFSVLITPSMVGKQLEKCSVRKLSLSTYQNVLKVHKQDFLQSVMPILTRGKETLTMEEVLESVKEVGFVFQPSELRLFILKSLVSG